MSNVGSAASGQTLIGAGNGASPTFASIGTNSGLTANGLVIAQNTGPFTATGSGTAGQVLTSNGAGVDPSFQGSAISFLAYQSASVPNVTGDGTVYNVIFDTLTYQVGTGYNNANGFFTAPVAGNYAVSGCVAVTGFGTSAFFSVYISTSVALLFSTNNNVLNTGVNGFVWLPFSAIIRLPAGNNLNIQVAGTGGTKNNTIFGSSAWFTWLSCALVS